MQLGMIGLGRMGANMVRLYAGDRSIPAGCVLRSALANARMATGANPGACAA